MINNYRVEQNYISERLLHVYSIIGVPDDMMMYLMTKSLTFEVVNKNGNAKKISFSNLTLTILEIKLDAASK